MRPRRNPKNPELAKAAADADADDSTYWPGEGLREGGQTIDKKQVKSGEGAINEETRLPETTNNGRLYTDKDSNAR